MTMIIEVTETHPPAPGKRVGYIHTSTGQRFECWPDKMNTIVVGRSYEVELREREYNGRTITSVAKIAPADGAPASDPRPINRSENGSAAGEAEYVGRVLAALIEAGQIDKQSIAAATSWLRKVWKEQP